MKANSLCIYWFHSSREVAETSPYYEALKKDDVEVGFLMGSAPPPPPTTSPSPPVIKTV